MTGMACMGEASGARNSKCWAPWRRVWVLWKVWRALAQSCGLKVGVVHAGEALQWAWVFVRFLGWVRGERGK